MPTIRAGSRIIALWPEGLKSDLNHTKPAFDLIDPEWVSSAPSILRDLHNKIQSIKADKMLSEIGKQENIQAVTRSAMNRLKSKGDSVKRQEQQLRELAESAVNIPTPGQNDTLIDIAMAGLLRQQMGDLKADGKATTLRMQSDLDSLSDRAKLAVLRLPVELSGINVEMQEHVRSSFVPPATARVMQETFQAIDTARQGVQAVLEEMISLSSFPNHEAAEIMGDTWNARAVPPGRQKSDLDSFKPARVKNLEEAQAAATTQAEQEVQSWAMSEGLAGREVSEVQKQAKKDELIQLGLQMRGIDKVWKASDKLGDANTPEDKQAIIQARLNAQKATV
ncbi:MAG: hypothetical protein Q8Q82_13805 [Hydrogenophaga sp.]|nr:hypothetical protein [Hydrogenophaga sp.]